MELTELNQRQIQLIRHLMDQNTYTTVPSLASRFSVSTRTIRNDLKTIGLFLNDYDAELKREPHKGVRIVCLEEAKGVVLNAISSQNLIPRKSRAARVILELLCQDICTYESLAGVCGVSRQTVITCFPSVEKYMNDQGLTVVKEKGNGVYASGDECSFRDTFARIIRSGLVSLETVKSMEWAEWPQTAQAVSLLKKAQDILHVSYYDPDETCLILNYSLMRIAQGHLIGKERIPKTIADLAAHEGFSDAASLIDPNIPERDRIWLASILVSGTARWNVGATASSQAGELARDLMERLQVLHPLSGEEQKKFLDGLSVHLETALYRLRNHIPVQNSMTSQIQISIPLIYEYTRQQLVNCEKKYDVIFDDNETAYIAMYVASAYESSSKLDHRVQIMVVCTFGTATSAILAARLRQVMPDCSIIGPCSKDEAVQFLQNHVVDMIVSTDHESSLSGHPVMTVSPLLYHDNIDSIRSQAYQIAYEKMCNDFLSSYSNIPGTQALRVTRIRDLMQAEDIQILEECSCWEQAIQLAAQPLLKKGKLEQRYVDRMIDAVAQLGTYMVIVPETAFVHAGTGDGIREECYALLVLKKPLIFGDRDSKRVSCIVVTGIKDREKSSLLDLVYIFSKEENRRLLHAKDVTKEIILNMDNRKGIHCESD